MAVKSALELIRKIERTPALKHRLRSLSTSKGLSVLVAAGIEQDLFFTKAELRSAFAIDWAMRFFHYSASPNPQR